MRCRSLPPLFPVVQMPRATLEHEVPLHAAGYDHVVIDAPPLLGLADSTLLARSTEGVIYVVEAQGLSIRGINQSLARLTDSHARVLGVVLTKLRRDLGSSYGYGYGYGLKYGDGDGSKA